MLSPRQIHLDFHTSECIPDIAAQFDAQAFAKTMKAAHVSSVTVFAKGHHGWLYYDSKRFPELVHPNLKNKNLLLEQVRELHKQGINAPIYITVQWDYHTATTHPEWLVRKADGAHEGDSFTQAGFYQSLCVNTGYVDFLKAQTEEIVTLLGDELDGIFFDIVGIRPCLCASCRAEMKRRGIDMNDEQAVGSFTKFVLDRFKLDMTEFVRGMNKKCTIFYNAGHVGTSTKASKAAYTHFELESLPSGGWGYMHFPVTARYARTLGLDCMGMTGKFHTSWGDFHSLKNLPALEFEAFRMLSFGFACSIGDQLEPCGQLNAGTYRLIGKVYAQYEAREKYGRGAKPVVEAAVITAESVLTEHAMSNSLMGAALLLEECGVQFDIIDPDMALDKYKLIVIPDDVRATPELAQRLNAYTAAGGKVLACGRGGLNDKDEYPECFGAKYAGQRELYPDFIQPNGELAQGLDPDCQYAIYEQGAVIEPNCPTAQTALAACAPYFKRDGDHFCSHMYTPSARGAEYPAALENGNVLLFSHPMFAQYRINAPLWVKTIIRNALKRVLPNQLVKHNGASTVTVQLLEKDNATYAHILSYIPVRKSNTIDIIEERTQARDLTLTLALPHGFNKATLVPEGTELPVSNGSVTIPVVDGYAIVMLENN